jgi:hypothetical protein
MHDLSVRDFTRLHASVAWASLHVPVYPLHGFRIMMCTTSIIHRPRVVHVRNIYTCTYSSGDTLPLVYCWGGPGKRGT